MDKPRQGKIVRIVHDNAYALGYRVIAEARAEPIIDTDACDTWIATQPIRLKNPQHIRRGSFFDHASQFPEADDE